MTARILTALTVRNFRNLASLNLTLPPEGAVILGANGHGKTNLLEAVYYLVLFRSLRGAKDRELVRFGEAGFFVAGQADARITVGYEVAGKRKKVAINGTEHRKLADAVGHVTAVAFSPGDRVIVAGGPAGRRRYLDIVLALTEPGYLPALTAMRLAVRQRNAALRLGRRGSAVAFDAPFASAASVVASARRQWTARHRERYAELTAALGEAAPVSLRYHADHHRERDGIEDIHAGLQVALERDLRRGMTTVGPHRDDLHLGLDGKDLRTYGSAGQQRTAAIALRLLEAESIQEATGQAPIALYDDVFAELDRDRQERLLDLISTALPGQAIVAAPRESEVPTGLLALPRWRMQEGRLGT